MFMTPEERERYDRVDRQLEFLAAHQAQFSSDLTELRRVTAEHSQQIARHGEQIAKQGEQIASLGGQIVQLGGHVRSLTDTVGRLAHVVDERDRQTDAKINALIGVVEKYFSNGKKPS